MATIAALAILVAGCDGSDVSYRMMLLTPYEKQDASTTAASVTPAPQSDSREHPPPAVGTPADPAAAAPATILDNARTNVFPPYGFIGAMVMASGAGGVDVRLPSAIEETEADAESPIETTPTIPVDPSEMKDVLGSATTSYAGSVPPRAHNVRLGTSRLNGAMVAPGEVFSFNEFVGPTTLDAGFQKGFGIIMSGGQAETVESVAGGICQVSTTLFQAVYWAGLEVVERWHHSYWIERYGRPPSGFTGLDTTVDDPSVDFKFRNNTGNWIWIESTFDDETITFTIYGIDPGWKVVSTEPEITEVIKASPVEVIREDPDMLVGEAMLIEHAQDGFAISATRQVFDEDGNVLTTYKFVNRYLPARNVWLVGTKEVTPEATPTPIAPTATPASRPEDYRQPDGRIAIPNLVGLAEDDAQHLIAQVGLTTTYVNYQGIGDIPNHALNSVPVGHVLSQMPASETSVSPGTIVYIAVRRDQTAFQDASP